MDRQLKKAKGPNWFSSVEQATSEALGTLDCGISETFDILISHIPLVLLCFWIVYLITVKGFRDKKFHVSVDYEPYICSVKMNVFFIFRMWGFAMIKGLAACCSIHILSTNSVEYLLKAHDPFSCPPNVLCDLSGIVLKDSFEIV